MALYELQSRNLPGKYQAIFIAQLFTFGFIFSITPTAVLAREFKGLSFVKNDGSILIYDCSVIGEGSTVWTGGGFDCPGSNNRITLKNAAAKYITTLSTCNSGSIIGRGVSVAGDHFTSELDINYTPDLKGKNVTCIYDNGSVEVIIGTTPIVYVPEQTNSDVTVLAVIFVFVGLVLVFVGSYSCYRMRLHRPMPHDSAGSALSHCQESIDREEITPLLPDSGEAIGTNVVTNLSDNDSTTVLMQETKPIQGEVHQSTYFSTAKERDHVPFLDHQILEIDFSGREYTNVNHDFTVRIPEGAVAEGEKIHFEVGVAMYGPFIFPENTQPISPILWLCILEGDAQLRKPFQIVLPHYLTGLSKDRIEHHHIRFAKANHSDYTFIDTQMSYKFHQCITKPLLASTGYRNYGVLVSKHCCFYCLTAQTSRELAFDAGYCLV